MRDGYKQTTIGVIPLQWEIQLLKNYLLERPDYGINAPAVPYSDRLPAYVRITDITEDGRLSLEKPVCVNHPHACEYFLKAGDIVLARTGASVGKSYLYKPNDGKLVFAGFLIRLQPDAERLLPSFLAAYLTTDNYWKWVRLMSQRSGQPGVNSQEYGQLPIPVPPLAEQTAIATALSDVDALLNSLDQLIAKKRNLKQAAMQQLLTGQTRLPGFSGEWEVKLLGQLAEIVMGQSPSSSSYNTTGIGLPLIQGNADIDNRKTIRRVFTTQVSKRGRNGDILMSVRAPVGEVSRAVFDVCLGRGVCAIRYENDFMYHCLIHLEPTWKQRSKGSTFDSVNSGDVRSLEIYLPADRSEQTAIAEVLTQMDAELITLEARREKTVQLKQGMMQELLTGKTRLKDFAKSG